VCVPVELAFPLSVSSSGFVCWFVGTPSAPPATWTHIQCLGISNYLWTYFTYQWVIPSLTNPYQALPDEQWACIQNVLSVKIMPLQHISKIKIFNSFMLALTSPAVQYGYQVSFTRNNRCGCYILICMNAFVFFLTALLTL